MQRIKIEIAYDGTRYHGWQRQADLPSIQETLEKNILQITGEKTTVTGSGRTDAGVHALKQVAAFTTKSTLTPEVFQRALNGFLPHDIRILHADTVPLSFHPIRHAVSKRYRYLIDDQQPNCPVIRNYCWGYREPLDIPAMQESAKYLLGTHDFACFQTQGSPRQTTVRTVSGVSVLRQTDSPLLPPLIRIEIEADGFLYNMVRAIAGTLALIGTNAKRKTKHKPPNPISIQEMIESKNRSLAGPTAPPHGLYLIDVVY
ncbi:MAG: tRNA pseudouridine(38-40) synthase TruA [Planctomycetaceae bacterium]|jgi:tRNA pseudouridine38-40 synthase|nr:tRNA pseudouridine(38-40) synthase TruA [Planctomycetaceae bacterium]